MKHFEELEREVSAWPNVSVHPHRFGGLEFRFGAAEIGHVHSNGVVDILYPRAIRDELLATNLAEEHHWVPNSGWATFRVLNQADLDHAVWLMRLSYLRYALKLADKPIDLLERESKTLRPSPRLLSLLEAFVRIRAANTLERQELA
jgi:Family of unknown function (DUF5519)